MTLDAAAFFQYFGALWGVEPFPWQERLAAQVIDGGHYPAVLALGTGTGKTSLIDIHAFALAADALRPPAERRLPRRLFFVVDRRVIVDQAHQRACDIAARLNTAQTGILREVADALRTLSAGGPPIAAAVLRGGMVRDESWAHTPDQPLIVSSTVDQVGSRLLFRGYGVSEGMAPIHAGLVGADSLIVLDEVHLAVPFRQTLAHLVKHYRADLPQPFERWSVVTMSATPGDAKRIADEQIFRLEDADREHPQLRRRLEARRPAVLLNTTATGSDSAADRKAITMAALKATLECMALGHRAIGVVVNRVDIARDLWAALQKKREVKQAKAELALVTGRMRGIDKAVPLAVMHKVRAGRTRQEDPDHPVIIVSTQSIEAGADLDFDALVTQAASIDALQQRFGRLNRMGRFGSVSRRPRFALTAEDERPPLAQPPQPRAPGVGIEASWRSAPLLHPAPRDPGDPGVRIEARAVILCPPIGEKVAPDPIYGEALAATVAFLRTIARAPEQVPAPGSEPERGQSPPAQMSFAIDELNADLARLSEDARGALSAPTSQAPIVLPTYVDLWCQTRPRPWPDPEVAPFLHGPQHAPDVQIVWRQELTEELLDAAHSEPEDIDEGGSANPRVALDELIGRFEALPTSSIEALRVPIYAARAWLDAVAPVTVADMPVQTAQAREPKRDADRRLALRWAGEGSAVVRSDELRVGDTLVVPVSYGGLNSVGVWDPTNTEIVTDRGEEAQWRRRGRAVVYAERHRTGDAELDRWLGRVLADEVLEDGKGAFETKGEERRAIKAWLRRLAGGGSGWLSEAARHLAETGYERLIMGRKEPRERGVIVLVGRRPRGAQRDFAPDASSHTGGAGKQHPITLREHCADVAAVARAFGERLGLPEPLIGDLALAGRLHDLGKVDSRFQQLLAGGDPVRVAMLDEPLAKSGLSPGDKAARDEAQRRSGYPRGARHELMSLVLAEAAGDLLGAQDADLVRHLVASHHGWARPLGPAVPDPEPVEVVHPFAPDRVMRSSQHDLAEVGSGLPERFKKLNAKYGPHVLAWLEAILRLADHRASAYPQAGGAS